MTTSTTTRTIAAVRRTKKFKALLTVGLDENAALKALGHPVAAPQDEKVAALIAGGFTEDEARQALALAVEQAVPADVPADVPVEAPQPPKPVTSKSQGDQLVEEHGFAFAKGRVYVTPDTIEAAVRVRKTGKPEIIASSGVGRTAAVLLFKEDSGDVALQNLTKGA